MMPYDPSPAAVALLVPVLVLAAVGSIAAVLVGVFRFNGRAKREHDAYIEDWVRAHSREADPLKTSTWVHRGDCTVDGRPILYSPVDLSLVVIDPDDETIVPLENWIPTAWRAR
jgi:hypothetical protein